MFFNFGIRFLICVSCIQFNTSLDVKKLLYKYVAVCGFDYLCDPKTALLPNMTSVPNIVRNGKTKTFCKRCNCDEDCFRYVALKKIYYWLIVDSIQYRRFLDLPSQMVRTFYKPPSIRRDLAP